ncbi:MAG: hypothetical protein MUC87_15085 [Bacteroidia bacterium]|nr:hypothetical protein [Bacteroidia bacterium]
MGLNEVTEFVREQHLNEIGFTPVTDFHTCMNRYTGYKAYTRNEAAALNRKLAEAAAVCEQHGTSIYQVCIDVFHEICNHKREALALGLDVPPEPPFYHGDPSFSNGFTPKRRAASKQKVG